MRSVFAYAHDSADPAALFAGLAGQPYSLFFDSADQAHPLGRYSFIACSPFERIEARRDAVTITKADGTSETRTGDPFAVLEERLRLHGILECLPRADLPPFQGGAAGYFGYDLARGLERLPAIARASDTIPDMAVGLYDGVLAFDHKQETSWLIVLAQDEQDAQEKRDQLERQLSPAAPISRPDNTQPSWSHTMSRADYESDIRKVIDYICAGDIFQANLSQRFECDLPPDFDAYAHYSRLRQINAAPFAAFMNFGEFRLASASPERFLSLQGRDVETRPIKGTSRRSTDPKQDKAAQEKLCNSEKDRAENTMIVDLLRNDLSRVCDDDSVEVPRLRSLESFASVHHLVSIVTGRLRAGQSPVDLLRACFPGGSITGAPKIRAMEIIEELEPARRGPYCGAMGYIGAGGAMDTNIVIRTLVYESGKVWFNTGGGITADSDPAAEYQETLDKAASIFRSFGNPMPETRKKAGASS